MQNQIKPIHWATVSFLGFIWGSTFLVQKLALSGITPFWLAAVRITLGAIVLTTFWQLRGGKLFETTPTRLNWFAVFVVGSFSSAFPFMLLSWGQQHVSSGFTGVSMAAVALMVLPLAHIFVPDSRLTIDKLVGVVIGFVGVALLVGGTAFASTDADLEWAGRIACLTAALCYSISTITMRGLPKIDPIGLAAVMVIVGAGVSITAAVIVEGAPQMPDVTTLGYLVILGLFPTALANLLLVFVVRSAGPVFMSLVNYQVPVWSIVLGALVLSEPLPPSMIYALILILCGMAISQWKALRALF